MLICTIFNQSICCEQIIPGINWIVLQIHFSLVALFFWLQLDAASKAGNVSNVRLYQHSKQSQYPQRIQSQKDFFNCFVFARNWKALQNYFPSENKWPTEVSGGRPAPILYLFHCWLGPCIDNYPRYTLPTKLSQRKHLNFFLRSLHVVDPDSRGRWGLLEES